VLTAVLRLGVGGAVTEVQSRRVVPFAEQEKRISRKARERHAT
jgi:hypothetical protein